MQSRESDQIFTQLGRAFQKGKAIIFLCVVAVLAPVVYFNETATPIYEAGTTIVFDEFVGPVQGFSSKTSHDVLTTNRLQEIKSYAFAEDIVKALSPEDLARFEYPDVMPANFDSTRHLASMIQSSLIANGFKESNLIRIGVELSDPVLCATVANKAAEVYQERSFEVKQTGVQGIRRFVEQQLERFQVQLDRSEQALRSYKERNKVAAFDRQAEEILRRMTEAEVHYNTAQAERKALEERYNAIQSRLDAQRRDLVPNVTDVSNPTVQRMQERLVELQLLYTELLVQEYPSDHPKLLQLEEEILQTKRSLTNKAMEIASGESVLNPIEQMEGFVTESVSIQIEIEALKAQEKALKSAISKYDRTLSSLPEKELNLARLTRERDVNQKIYNGLLEKLEQSKINQAERLPTIRILDQATIPEEPIRPRKKVNLVLGFLVGLIAGVTMAFAREASRGGVESNRWFEERTGWAVLGAIPKIQRIPPVKLKHSQGPKRNERDSRRIKRSLISVLQPDGGPAEAYRMLRTNLEMQGLGEDVRTVLVTSSAPNDGKSTVASNLAIAAASKGHRTLLLDAEVRRPGMHVVFDVEQKPGLVDVLLDARQRFPSGGKGPRERAVQAAQGGEDSPMATAVSDSVEAKLKSAVHSKMVSASQNTRIRNLQVLAAGATVANTSDSLSMHEAELGALLGEASKQHQVVVIDAPPLTLVHDAALLARMADAVVFVVNAAAYDHEMVMSCKSLLETAGTNVLGAVLNHVDPIGIYKSNKYYTNDK